MLRLRPYKQEDAETILSWCKDEKAFYKWTAGRLGEYPITAEQFGKVQEHMAFVAMDDHEPAGFFIMRYPTDSFDEIRFGYITVNSEIRGKGYGKAMLQLGLKYAKEICGAKKVTLGVFENNPQAYHCYRSIGLKESATREPEILLLAGEEWKCLELEIEI